MSKAKELLFLKEDVQDAARLIKCDYEELVDALARTVKQGFSIIPMYDNPYPAGRPAGRRCRFSDLGRRELAPRHPWDLGWCILGRDPSKLAIKWDWQKSHQREHYHRDFIEVIEAS